MPAAVERAHSGRVAGRSQSATDIRRTPLRTRFRHCPSPLCLSIMFLLPPRAQPNDDGSDHSSRIKLPFCCICHLPALHLHPSSLPLHRDTSLARGNDARSGRRSGRTDWAAFDGPSPASQRLAGHEGRCHCHRQIMAMGGCASSAAVLASGGGSSARRHICLQAGTLRCWA